MTVLHILKAPALLSALVWLAVGIANSQDTSGNKVEIAQDGNLNQTAISQSGANNLASVQITGSRNGQTAGTLTQDGAGAYAEIYIEGDRNDFDIAQSGAASAGALYGSIYGQDNTFRVEQINALSDAYQNYGSIAQNGDANSAALAQIAAAYAGMGGLNAAYITQNGDGNSADITQTGEDNYAAISQEGDGNQGTIVQVGAGLFAELNQVGNNLPGYTITQDCIQAECNQGIIVNQTAFGLTLPPPGAGS